MNILKEFDLQTALALAIVAAAAGHLAWRCVRPLVFPSSKQGSCGGCRGCVSADPPDEPLQLVQLRPSKK